MIRQFDAQIISDNLLRQFPRGFSNPSLWESGWRTSFTKSTKFLGSCDHDNKRIIISILHLNSASDIEVRDTILHEIAHALVGPNKGHGDEWIAMAKSIGIANPKPCGAMDVDAARSTSESEIKEKTPLKFGQLQTLCPTCSKVFVEATRLNLAGAVWTRGECGHLVKKDNLVQESLVDKLTNWRSAQGHQLFDYQVQGINFAAQGSGRVLIADEPGLGKTAQGIGFTYWFKELATPCLWVCKAKLKTQAVKEYLDWCGAEFMPQVINTAKDFILPGLKVYVISMDLLKSMSNEKLAKCNIKTVIADEIQHFKNPDSTRTSELRRIVSQANFFLPLSGTPWKNRGDEYFPVLNMLDPRRFPSYAQFDDRWVDTYYDDKACKFRKGGIRNIDKFKEYTKDLVIRRLRSEVQPNLPKINRQMRFVDLDKYGEAYEKAEGKVAAALKDMILEGGNNSGMNMIAELMKLKHITGIAKVETCVEDVIQFIEDKNGECKLSIGHHHIDVGDFLEQELNKYLTANGYAPCLRIKGGESDKVYETQEEFKNNPKAIVMLLSTLAAGEGLNLQFCIDAMQLERQWNSVNEEQFELRFSRPLNLNSLPVYLKERFESFEDGKIPSIRFPYYIAADTIDEMLTEIVERKRINFLKAMNSHVCSKCNSRNTTVKDDMSTCMDCGEHVEFKWDQADIVKELSEAIIRKRYGK